LLLSTRISSDIAVATARELFSAGWRTPGHLRESTWQERVDALGRGGYRRYDERTVTRLDDAAALLLDRWKGDLRRLRDEAEGDPRRIADLLQAFDGIGPTGANIFLREVQQVWPAVPPSPTSWCGRAPGPPGCRRMPSRWQAWSTTTSRVSPRLSCASPGIRISSTRAATSPPRSGVWPRQVGLGHGPALLRSLRHVSAGAPTARPS